MLTKQTEINFKDYTISRQVIDGVIENLLKLTRIENPDIIYSTVLTNSNLTQNNAPIGEGRKADFGVNDDQVLLEVTEKRSEDNRIMRGIGLIDVEQPIFVDKEFGVSMYSNSVEYEVEVEIQLRHSSRSRAEAWNSDKMSRIESGLETFVTSGDFHYVVPQTCYKLADDVMASAKINNPAEVRTGREYFEKNLTTAVSLVTDQAGKSLTPVATQRVSRVEVIFENGSILKEKDEKGVELGGFVSKLSCNFKYSRPETIILRYPVMVNGTLINKDWWFDGTVPGLSDDRNAIATPFINAGEAINPQLPFLQLPRFLQDVDYQVPTFTKRDASEIPLIIAYIDYTPPQGDVTLLFNLKELGTLTLTDTTIEYIAKSISDNEYLYSSVFSVYLMVGGSQVILGNIMITPDFNVWYNGIMSLSEIHQVVITLNPNMANIDDDTFDILRQHPTFTGNMLADLYPPVYKKYKDYLLDETINAQVLINLITDAKADPLSKSYQQLSLRSGYLLTILNGRIIAH